MPQKTPERLTSINQRDEPINRMFAYFKTRVSLQTVCARHKYDLGQTTKLPVSD